LQHYRLTRRKKIIGIQGLSTARPPCQITAAAGKPPPAYEWPYTFYPCQNSAFSMKEEFGFSSEWDGSPTVGKHFAYCALCAIWDKIFEIIK
jgi:hypothetical protein